MSEIRRFRAHVYWNFSSDFWMLNMSLKLYKNFHKHPVYYIKHSNINKQKNYIFQNHKNSLCKSNSRALNNENAETTDSDQLLYIQLYYYMDV